MKKYIIRIVGCDLNFLLVFSHCHKPAIGTVKELWSFIPSNFFDYKLFDQLLFESKPQDFIQFVIHIGCILPPWFHRPRNPAELWKFHPYAQNPHTTTSSHHHTYIVTWFICTSTGPLCHNAKKPNVKTEGRRRNAKLKNQKQYRNFPFSLYKYLQIRGVQA